MRRYRHRQLRIESLENRYALSYAAIDLGSDFTATSINNAGLVAGAASSRAALWQNGSVLDLGAGYPSQANDINDSGQVVGYGYLPGLGRHAFLITPEDTDNNGQPDRWFRDVDCNAINDLIRDLGTLGGPTSEARGINNLGQVVGRADMSTAAGSYRAFLWDSAAGMRNLGTFGGTASEGTAINDSGAVVGNDYVLSPIGTGMLFRGVHAFRWDAVSGGSLLPKIPGNWPSSNNASMATEINENGQVVGTNGYTYSTGTLQTSYSASDAILWNNGSGTTLLGFSTQSPQPQFDVSINDNGQVVGLGSLWQPDEGRIALNSLLDPSLGWSISAAADMNDGGQIVGRGTHDGWQSTVLLTSDATTLPPLISVSNMNIPEGDAGPVAAVFNVSLSRASDQIVTITFATADGTAKAGSDYVAATGTVTFNPGETSQTIGVTVMGDLRDEYDKKFSVLLSNSVGALIADAQAIGTIVDNDPPPTLSINDVQLKEGNSGVTYFVFTVSLSDVSDKTITVNYATANGTAIGSGKNADYQAASGSLTFAPGETTKTITIAIIVDTRKEANETFFLNLAAAVDAAILDGQGLGTILNDD